MNAWALINRACFTTIRHSSQLSLKASTTRFCHLQHNLLGITSSRAHSSCRDPNQTESPARFPTTTKMAADGPWGAWQVQSSEFTQLVVKSMQKL